MITALTILSYFGIAQALFLALVYFSGYGKHQQHRGLGWLFLLFTVAMASIVLSSTIGASFNELLEHVEYLLTFSAGPVLYVVANDLRRNPSLSKTTLSLHFSPAILYLALVVVERMTGPLFYIPILIPLLHMQAYSGWLVYTVLKNRLSPEQPFAEAGQSWLNLLSILLVTLHAAQWMRILLPDAAYMEFLIPVTAFASMYALMIFGFLNPALYTDSGTFSFKRSALQFRKQLNLLEHHMSKQQMYRNQHLTLDLLASEMNIPSNEISFIINKGLNKNFNEWINQYRVNLVKELLDDAANHHLTIDALAEEAGFNSRSSFYDAFKKVTGTTPTKYRQNR